MKKWLVVFCLLVFSTGCINDMSTEQIYELAREVDGLSGQFDNYQRVVVKSIEDLEESGEVPSEVAARIATVASKVDEVQVRVSAVTKAIQDTDLGERSDLEAVLEAIKVGNQATTPWNPYAPVIDAVLLGVASITTIFARKKSKESEANRLKYQAHKQATSKFMLTADNGAAKELYDDIGKARECLGVK